MSVLRLALPTRSIALLMLIGFADLISTAWLHHQGLIRELNPIMRPMLEHGELPFIMIKSLTLLVAWYALARYARKDLSFVRLASVGGSLAYVTIWTVWFCSAR